MKMDKEGSYSHLMIETYDRHFDSQTPGPYWTKSKVLSAHCAGGETHIQSSRRQVYVDIRPIPRLTLLQPEGFP